MRTGYFRDLDTINNFLKHGACNEAERREVIRCLRPLLEGFVRFKYYDLIGPNQWLGNFIDMIREAKPGSVIAPLNGSGAFDDLCLVNDYSKTFHHANPGEQSVDINDEELHFMAEKTLSLLKIL
jgi:wobble nucleotide-excising tRNase